MPNDNNKRGFGSMDDDKQRDISSKGGKASHEGQHASSQDGGQSKSAGGRGGSHEQHVKAGQQSHKNS